MSSSLSLLGELAEFADFVQDGVKRTRKLCDIISQQTRKGSATQYYKVAKVFDSLISETYDKVFKKDGKTLAWGIEKQIHFWNT